MTVRLSFGTYRFYFVAASNAPGYLKHLNGNRFRLIIPPPRFSGNTSLLRYMVVFHNAREDVRCRHNPITAAGLAKVGQCFTLQVNIQFFIGIIGVQNLEGRTLGSEPKDCIIEKGLIYARDDIDEFLSTLFRRDTFRSSEYIIQVPFHSRRSGHEGRDFGRRVDSVNAACLI